MNDVMIAVDAAPAELLDGVARDALARAVFGFEWRESVRAAVRSIRIKRWVLGGKKGRDV